VGKLQGTAPFSANHRPKFSRPSFCRANGCGSSWSVYRYQHPTPTQLLGQVAVLCGFDYQGLSSAPSLLDRLPCTGEVP